MALAATVSQQASRLDRSRAPFSTQEEVKSSCGRMEVGVDFASEDYTLKVEDVPSASGCCSRCEEEPKCGAWTWGMVRNNEELTDVCFMKELEEGQSPTMKHSPELVSGLAARMQQASVNVSSDDSESDGSDGDDGYNSASLYCFVLVIPGSYEPKLLRYQYQESASIFACDAYTIYSNQEIDVAEGVNTSIVESDLKCENGGEFGTALNLKIFLAVWTKVINDAEFRFHGWTVKADVDSVFFPQRLRHLLAYQKEPLDGGVYLNNCKYGLHGPLEVFSRRAVQAWALGSAECIRHFTRVCSGDCFWGEDLFIDQCLWKVLKVKRADEFGLLTEDHCDAPDNWRWCQDPSMVAFHPFKTVDGWKNCFTNATTTQ